jgi:putative ABC transport system ATP-binding protein
MNNPLLEARGIGRLAPLTGQWLLKDIDLAVRGGDRVAIVGPNGSGKTLLLRALTLLDPIEAGVILWQGQPLSAQAIPHYRRDVIYLHQRPVLTDGSVEDNLRRPFELHCHRPRGFDRAVVLDFLRQHGLEEAFLAKSARELSGGEGQVVSLLRAIQLEPHVLLLDEPTAALDARTVTLLEQCVAHWQEASPGERAVIWVSHNRDQVERVADRILAMKAGVLSGSTT